MKKSSTHKKQSGKEVEHRSKRSIKKVFRDVDVKLGRKRR